MAGWPGTMPVHRLLKAHAAIKRGILSEKLDPQTGFDVLAMLHAHKAHLFSTQPRAALSPNHGTEAQRYSRPLDDWEHIVSKAREVDDQFSMGGVMVWKRRKTEGRALFQLMRHHDVLGLNKIFTHMRGMNITIFESRALAGQPGLILAESRWDEYQNSLPQNNLPEGEATYLRQVLGWHGAKLFRWAARE